MTCFAWASRCRMNRDRSHTDYRILVSREATRPRAKLFIFNVPQDRSRRSRSPCCRGTSKPELDLGAILHALYDRARFDLRLDYAKPPVPPLAEGDRGVGAGRSSVGCPRGEGRRNRGRYGPSLTLPAP